MHGQKYIITRSHDTKWYTSLYKKIDDIYKTRIVIDIAINPEIILKF